MRRFTIVLSAILALVLSFDSKADFYKWQDKDGVWHYSNTKPPDNVDGQEISEQLGLTDHTPQPASSTGFDSLHYTPSETWQGKCVGISDGDTIEVLHNGMGIKIRLYGIDTPEIGQDFGTKAKQFTSEMAFGKIVNIDPMDKDRYGRTVAMVYFGKGCLNEELIKNGYAWVYRKYCRAEFRDAWLQIEEEARISRKGIWSHKGAIPPWEFRHSTVPTSTNQQSPTSAEAKPAETTYHGNVKSLVFHRPGCRYFNCKSCRVVFRTREEAINAGYKPCNLCNP